MRLLRPLGVESLEDRVVPAIGGFAFLDYNANGKFDTGGTLPNLGGTNVNPPAGAPGTVRTATDVGFGGLSVRIFDAAGTLIDTQTTAPVTGTVRYRIGDYYNGNFNALELTSDFRFTARVTASVGWTRQDISLPGPGRSFVDNRVPVKRTIAFTNLASLSLLAQYNGQTGQYSTNARLALLNRSGTGLFVVYNDRRDVLDSTSYDTVGRSFVIKFTRLFDM